MEGYLGEEIVPIESTEYRDFKTTDWVLHWVGMYGYIDGEHHKKWLLDQVAQIACGTTVIIKKAKWQNGYCEFRFSLSEPSREYKEWIGDDTDYDAGIAP